jgi:Arc/MetJ family transcription regulator
MMLFLMLTKETAMRTTIMVEDELLARAKELTGTMETSAVIRKGLAELIARESQRRLVLLKGSLPNLVAPTRRQFDSE